MQLFIYLMFIYTIYLFILYYYSTKTFNNPINSFSDVPSQPGKPTVIAVTHNSATLSWPRPRNDGGSPITNYLIESKSSSGYRWIMVNIGYKITHNEYTVTELMEGTTYEFRFVSAKYLGDSDSDH